MSELDINFVKDGQKAIATIAQSGDIVSSGGEIDATCVVQTDDGKQKAVKTTAISGTIVSEPSEISAHALVETANGDKELCVKTYSLGGDESGGGGGSTDGDYIMRVVDIDGTILKEEHLDEGETFTLPNPPTHERLTFVEWMSPLTITDNTVTVPNQSVAFGPIYTTKSGKHEFDIHLNAHTGLTVTLNMNGTKEWGDGTTDTETSHTYAQAGSYTILCDGNTVSSAIFGQAWNNVDFKCIAIRFATGITNLSSALQHLEGLRYISLPKGLTNASNMLSQSCLLKAVILPSTVTNNTACIGNSLIHTFAYNGNLSANGLTNSNMEINLDFLYINPSSQNSGISIRSFYSLKRAIVPSYSYSSVDCAYCYNLEELVGLENCGISAILNQSFGNCYSLKEIKFPARINNIQANAFQNCFECLVYDFSRCTAVPTLQNTNAFTGINAFAEIRVPTALYDSWKIANNWSTFADYIVAV